MYCLLMADELGAERRSLLRPALRDSMERVRERVIWLLSLIYPAKDIRGIWGALNSGDPTKQSHAVELLDNLLTGDIKRYTFPLYGDALEPARFKVALGFLDWSKSRHPNTALRMLLEQDDIWLAAATVWEIGRRGVKEVHDNISRFLDSDISLLRETAELVTRGFGSGGETDKQFSTIEKIIFLKSVDIFARLTVEQLGRIAGLTEEVHFRSQRD